MASRCRLTPKSTSTSGSLPDCVPRPRNKPRSLLADRQGRPCRTNADGREPRDLKAPPATAHPTGRDGPSKMRHPRWVACHATGVLILAALVGVPAWGAIPAQPGLSITSRTGSRRVHHHFDPNFRGHGLSAAAGSFARRPMIGRVHPGMQAGSLRGGGIIGRTPRG